MEPTKEQMYQWYVVEQKSYRQIMEITGIKNNRKIPKLLNEYGIEIRRGSEAVKAQWNNNESRREKQSLDMTAMNRGKISHRRLTDDELVERMKSKGFELLERNIVDSFTVMKLRCFKCKREYEKSLNNPSGCLYCGQRTAGLNGRLKHKEVESLFRESGVFLLDEYTISDKPLSFICVNHADIGAQKLKFHVLKQRGYACPYCRREKRMKNKGLTDRRIMHERLAEWRMAVYERDNYICQCCGWDKGGNLNAHHIQNFASHPHLRLDIENGITLCAPCHNPSIKGSFHHVYGVKDNTKEQLDEYIALKQSILT